MVIAGPLSLATRIGPRDIPRPNLEVPSSGSGDKFLGRELWDRQDYNPLLHGGKALEIYEKMRSTDGEIAGGLWRLLAPLHSGKWFVEVPEGEDPETHEPTEMCREMLMSDRPSDGDSFGLTWSDVLRHLLLMVPFGFSAFEKVWYRHERGWHVFRLSPIKPSTVFKFTFTADGRLESLTQLAFMLDTGRLETRTIPDPSWGVGPDEKLVVAVFGREGRNMFGRSALRTAWIHWHYKRGLIETDGIRNERSGVGIPWVEIPPGYVLQDGDKDAIESVTKNLRAHENQYVFLPPGMKLHVDYASGAEPKTIESIRYHDQQESRSLLAEFMATGTAETGSRAVVSSKIDFLLMSVQGTGRIIEDVVNRQIFAPAVARNFGAKAVPPRLQLEDLDKMSGKQKAEIFKLFVEAGMLKPDRPLRAQIREELELPPEDMATIEEPPPPKIPGGKPQIPLPAEFVLPKDVGRLSRLALDHERFCAFAEYARYLDLEPARLWQRIVKGFRDRIIVQLADDAARATDAQLSAGEFDVKLQARLTSELSKALMRTYLRGRESVISEHDRQVNGEPYEVPPPRAFQEDDDEEPLIEPTSAQSKWVRNLASVFVAGMIGALVNEARRVGTIARNADRGRIEQRADVAAALAALSEPRMQVDLAGEVNRAFANGRVEQAAEMRDVIDAEFYSAIMDTGTCGPCASLDGERQDPGADDWQTPNPNCEGGSLCRCITVYVFQEEAKRAA